MRAANLDEPGGAAGGGASLRAGHARYAARCYPREDADQEYGFEASRRPL